MKKLLVVGALALAVVVLSERQASAWCHCKFGVGLNFDYQAGGNNWLWGAFKNGQPPGCPDCINCAPNCPGCYYKNILHYGMPPGLGHAGHGYGAPGFAADGPMMGAPGMAPMASPVPTPTPVPGADSQVYWFNTPTYSNVNFHPSYYQQGGYFMPVSSR
ncbi:MAG: hypothetical protein FJ271_10110 [Planctomycetes bacterium]|nr:hypothetical protein [Planctomycetota bacterium]